MLQLWFRNVCFVIFLCSQVDGVLLPWEIYQQDFLIAVHVSIYVGHSLVHVYNTHQICFIVDYNKKWSISQLGVESLRIKCAIASPRYHCLVQCRNREGLAAITIPGDNEGVLEGQKKGERFVSALSLRPQVSSRNGSTGFFVVTHINCMVWNLSSPVGIERGTEFSSPLNRHDCVVSTQHRKLQGKVVWIFKQQSFHKLC